VLKLYHCDISKISDEEFEELYLKSEKSRQKKADKLKKKPAKKLSIAAGELVRNAISEEFNIEKDKIRFCVGKNGKPYTKSAEVEFSISHSKNIAVCAISDKPVGIDVEYIHGVNLSIVQKCFARDEQNYVFEDREKTRQRFFEIWTRKEAYVKLHGTGVSHFPEFSVMGNEDIETYVKNRYVVSVATTK